MRSQHVDRFNHDEYAPEYDEDVLDESNPIRTGYAELLAWVAASALELLVEASPPRRLLELGSGTGNLTQKLDGAEEIVCVDVSEEMTRIAREKLAALPMRGRLSFLNADLLEIFEHETMAAGFDVVVSTYTIHHLTEDERGLFFERLAAVLRPGGGFALGDLAFENEAARRSILDGYRRDGQGELADEIEDEFFWLLDACERSLERAGFVFEKKRFSELSWGVRGRLA